MPTGFRLHSSPSSARAWIIAVLWRALRLGILGLVLALFYVWAAPRFYPRDGVPGFWRGVQHGALMPMALPALAGGRDVTIYAERNSGRTYKLGYTIGINLCGLIVFGTAFWSPKRKEE